MHCSPGVVPRDTYENYHPSVWYSLQCRSSGSVSCCCSYLPSDCNGYQQVGGYGRYRTGVPIGFTLGFVGSVLRRGTRPALSIGLTTMGFGALGMRGTMILTEGEDFMILVAAKGLNPLQLLFSYRRRNAILLQIAGLAISFGGIVGGTVVLARVFFLPRNQPAFLRR